MAGTLIHCDNPWCTTATRAHKSAFAKQRCDRSKSRSVSLGSTLMPTSARSSEATYLGGSERVHVAFGDLSDASLAGAVIENAELAEAQGTDLAGATLNDVHFAGGVDSCALERVSGVRVLVSHLMRDSRLDAAKVTSFAISAGAVIENCSFAGARLNDSEWGARLRASDSSFRWASLRRGKFLGSLRFDNCDFSGCDLSNSTFVGDLEGRPTFVNCEFDMANLSGVDLRDTHFVDVQLAQRIYFIDADTLPPLEPGALAPTSEGREFLTRAMTEEQYADFTDNLGASEWDVRQALARLSPGFVPVYGDGTAGERGALLRRAMLGEDLDALVAIQAEVWAQSAHQNPLLVASPDGLYS